MKFQYPLERDGEQFEVDVTAEWVPLERGDREGRRWLKLEPDIPARVEIESVKSDGVEIDVSDKELSSLEDRAARERLR